jgi:hypothetical protein
MSKVVVKQNPEKEVPIEVLADAIVAISEGVAKMRSSRFVDRTLYMLIADAAPMFGNRQTVGIREVKAVIEGIASLEARHLKKRKQ